MKKRLLTIILFIIFIIQILFCIKSYGASSGIYSTDKTVTYGADSNVTVTVCSSVQLGSYMVTVIDTGGLTLTAASGGVISTDNKKVTSAAATGTTTLANFTFLVPNVSVETKFVIKFFIEDMEDYNNLDSYDDVTNTATVTVKPTTIEEPSKNPTESEEQNKVPEETQEPEPTYPTETNTSEATKEETKSSNNYLSDITLGIGKLSPEFYRETFEYTVEFEDGVNLYDLKEIEILATTEDSRATVTGTGTIQLQDGENNITLTVKAENGSARNYSIKLVKPQAVEQSSLRIKTLVLNGINTDGEFQTINLDFDPEVFEYNITVPSTIKSISVNPTTENEDIIIESSGGESLNEGNNRIIIILTSPSDDTIKTTYTINIEKQASLIIQEEKGIFNNRQLGIVIIVSIVVIILFISIIIAITKNRRKKKGFGYDEEDEDDNDSLEMNFINNEEGEDVEDYNEVESPYPNKIITNKQSKEETEELKQEEKNIAFKENKKEDELSSKTNYQEEEEKDNFTKSKWDNFVDGYEEEENKKGKKRKSGRRFM